ncbi:MAG TPA: acetylxylan esterase [Verrucomicrobiae bacterium]|nr:acetylxylan esterase [Verrucomicrobiae bacterium]
MNAKTLTFTVLFVLLTANLFAQESAAERQTMATNQLKRLAAEMSARCLTDIKSLQDWQKQRALLRRQFLEMLGLDPMPPRTPLKAQISGRLERDAYRIEKLVFQSLPGLYVTANFWLPKDSKKSQPAILYLCGHSPHPLGAKFAYQDRASWFASHGYPCLVLDTLEFGEISAVHHGTHNLNMWNWFSLGYTPAGVEVWNAIRALDYLETRPEVDMKRIGLTGISGGGAMTWYTAAVDERIAVAAPVCSTITFGTQAEHWLARGQCDCIYYNNTYAWDFPILGALIAPRPLMIISGQRDSIFPPDGYHEVFQRAKKVYDLYAGTSSDRITEVDDDVGHSDPPKFLNAARQWMQRWLKNDRASLAMETNALPQETAEDLACLAKHPSDAINYRIQNQFVRLEKQRDLLPALKEKVLRWFPSRDIPFDTKTSRNTGGYLAKYADYKELSFQTEEGVRVRALVFTRKQNPQNAPLLLYVKRAADSVYPIDPDELLGVFGHYNVIVLQPRFAELTMSAGDYTDVERTATWVGRTIASMQLWDMLRAVEWAAKEGRLPVSSVSVYGKGEMGIIAMYAALLDKRIQQIILNDPPESHWQGPALLNILRITDIPDVARTLGRRHLVSVTKPPATLAKHLRAAGSLPDALEVWKY